MKIKSGDVNMTYTHIKISAIPVPLGEIMDSQSATSKAIAAEVALVYAAPDLLAALEDLVGYAAAEIGIPPNEAVGGAFKQARVAIAKAKGQQ